MGSQLGVSTLAVLLLLLLSVVRITLTAVFCCWMLSLQQAAVAEVVV